MSRRPELVCPRCGSTRFARCSGLRGPIQHFVFLVLLLCFVLPALVYFLVKQSAVFVCRGCGASVYPPLPGA